MRLRRLWVFLCLMLAAVWSQANPAEPSFRIFAASSCGHCQALERYLSNTGAQTPPLAIHWYFIDKDRQALRAFYQAEKPYLSKINALQVPNMRICGERFVGFQDTTVDKTLLNEAMQRCLELTKLKHEDGQDLRLRHLADWYAYQHDSFAFMQTIPALFMLDALHMCAWFVWGVLLVVVQNRRGFSWPNALLAVLGITVVHAFGMFFPQLSGLSSLELTLLGWSLGLLFFAQNYWTRLKRYSAAITALCLPALIFYYQQHCEPSFAMLLATRIVDNSSTLKAACYALLFINAAYFFVLLGMSRALAYTYKRLADTQKRPYILWSLRGFASMTVILLWFGSRYLPQFYMSLLGVILALLVSYVYWRIRGAQPEQE